MSAPIARTILLSALTTAISAPVVRSWLRSQQTLDIPNERSSHTVPTPRGGGLACAAGAAATVWVNGRSPFNVSPEWAATSTLLATVGRVDDLRGLPAVPRLSSQLVAGAVVGLRSGGPTGAGVGAIALPTLVNAFNFMDGINGISGVTSGVWGIAVATNPALSTKVRIQGAVTAGMGLGFLPYNIPEASMFLGDVGSYLLGGGIAVTAIQAVTGPRGLDHEGLVGVLSPMVPYLVDTGSTLVKRMARGEKITDAHREHVYQRLVQSTEWPHWAVSALVASYSAASAAAARGDRGRTVAALLAVAYLASPAVARRVR